VYLGRMAGFPDNSTSEKDRIAGSGDQLYIRAAILDVVVILSRKRSSI
jgi:hypothetical protein